MPAEGLDLVGHGRDLIEHEAALPRQIPRNVLRTLEERDIVAKAAAPEDDAVIVARQKLPQLLADAPLPEEGDKADLVKVVRLDIGVELPAKTAEAVFFVDIDEFGELGIHKSDQPILQIKMHSEGTRPPFYG